MNNAHPNARGGRLQRPPTLGGSHIGTFRQILYRHGLTMGALALLVSASPNAQEYIVRTTDSFVNHPTGYLIAGIMLLAFLFTISKEGATEEASETICGWCTCCTSASLRS